MRLPVRTSSATDGRACGSKPGISPGASDFDATPEAQVAAIRGLVDGKRHVALVLYCNGPHRMASRRLAEELVVAGFTDVKRYQLGMAIWRALGGPTVIVQADHRHRSERRFHRRPPCR
jgi:rhodanese-related sulfurtransferase